MSKIKENGCSNGLRHIVVISSSDDVVPVGDLLVKGGGLEAVVVEGVLAEGQADGGLGC